MLSVEDAGALGVGLGLGGAALGGSVGGAGDAQRGSAEAEGRAGADELGGSLSGWRAAAGAQCLVASVGEGLSPSEVRARLLVAGCLWGAGVRAEYLHPDVLSVAELEDYAARRCVAPLAAAAAVAAAAAATAAAASVAAPTARLCLRPG